MGICEEVWVHDRASVIYVVRLSSMDSGERIYESNNYRMKLQSQVWRNWREGTPLDIIDPILRSGSTTEMMRCIHIGLLCVQENVADKPTMASVVLMLSSSSITLQIPSEPTFLTSCSTYQSGMSSSMGYKSRVTKSLQPELEVIPLSKNEASISELYPR
ncbi:unnamed protein product [Dovyalis caffra]|uniref:Uncharacterized protein n=1 Tax=Dovyalis caffra TaxID=77055 RepID=A0AAV1SIA8_9ROSI|nr:unnamed protein product [Dovyalis caffra]